MRRLVLHSCSTIISTSPICWLLSSCHINHGEITHLVFIFQNFLITLGISPKGKRTRNRETDIRRTRFTDDDGTCRMTTLTVMTTTTIERLIVNCHRQVRADDTEDDTVCYLFISEFSLSQTSTRHIAAYVKSSTNVWREHELPVLSAVSRWRC